ncbi:protein-lysine N-methyltransferase EEF2KMT [Phlebotomus papatasi]|uniref:protein-lysine N-methyltransferase EEF2KMT n=1 Tax=Phlebotomus papatasi TaxID=29031 RepID=UPI0024846A78|nr:protein-lysine N-methyltransferase EEF2KMT [Phlebotomus papatasi]
MISSDLQELQTKFLCGYPVKNLDFHKVFHNISWDAQKMFLQQTISHPLVNSKPISWSYQVAFLRVALESLEKNTVEVQEDFYTEYLRLQQLASLDQSHVYKHYRVRSNGQKIVSVRESPRLICDGTTGLRTWPASIALCEWFTHNTNEFSGKTILELGAGVGMAGIVLAQIIKTSRIYLTDFHEKVLSILQENLNENPPENDNVVHVCQFDWFSEVDYEKLSKTCCPDIIYAADVIYDSDIFPALCQVLMRFINSHNSPRIIISCTVRNEKTYEDFIEKLDNCGLCISPENLHEPNNFYWTDPSEIVIFSVNKKN